MRMILLALSFVGAQAPASLSAGNSRDQSFDADWRFLRADAPGAEAPAFDDSRWRKLDVPHDWSIEDLPPKETVAPDPHDGPEGKPARIGPFDPVASENRDKTGYTVGGIGWYRKRFMVNEANKRAAVRFDGVYMNPEVWLNGHRLE